MLFNIFLLVNKASLYLQPQSKKGSSLKIKKVHKR